MRKALIPFALLGGAALLFTGELYRYTFRREGSALLAPLLDTRGHEDAYYVRRDAAAAALRARPHETLHIRSARGEMLSGFYYPFAGEGKRIAFLIHGYRSEHAENAGLYADCWARLGFDLFCCDQTAHGQSEGKQIGFDYFESADCLLWIDELRRRFGGDLQLVLHGFSMGSATVMKMSADCPDCVRFLVADCGYADAPSQLRRSLGALYPLMAAINRFAAGCDLRQTDVRPSLRKASLPILFVHGKQDGSVPFSNSEELYALYEGPKDCFFVENARHVECMYVDPAGYEEHLKRFVEQYIT